jgi:hypothetical protein
VCRAFTAGQPPGSRVDPAINTSQPTESQSLELGEHAVRSDLISHFDKLGISSRAKLALYALGGPE